jgi:hypothetical protein
MDGWAAVKLATTGSPKVWVFRIEADFQWTGQDGSVSTCLDELSVCGKASYAQQNLRRPSNRNSWSVCDPRRYGSIRTFFPFLLPPQYISPE